MKKAVLVVGPHFSGKSKTIKKYFKPLVGMTEHQRNFSLHGQPGVALSQSTEEKRLGRVISQSLEEKGIHDVVAYISRYLSCQWLVLAGRPISEPGSYFKVIVALLRKSGFDVAVVEVVADKPESFYRQRAKEMLAHLS